MTSALVAGRWPDGDTGDEEWEMGDVLDLLLDSEDVDLGL